MVTAAFAPGGRTLATTGVAGNDGTVNLWDLSDRDRPRPLGRPLTGHTKEVNALAFTRDGRTMLTASADQTVRLWDLNVHAIAGQDADRVLSVTITRDHSPYLAPPDRDERCT
jgi:WD40 repeat protein